jgi:cell division protein FtsI/penicillin-binding protein 2
MGVVKDGQLHRLQPRVLAQPIAPETAKTLTRMMVETVDSYSIKNLAPGYRVAGKTGTAEISDERGYTSDLTITSCAGFLPAADPQVVILVKLDKPKKSKWAEKVALPVFQQVAGDAVSILKIAPDDRMP